MDQLMLPYRQIGDFLPKSELDAVLTYVLVNPGKFKSATVRSGDDNVVQVGKRVALTCGDLGPLETRLEGRFLDALPMIMESTGASGPPPDKLELELAAHGDGAFYDCHTDLLKEAASRRALSAVLYFHAEPKRFSGGNLRLFGLGPDPTFVEIEPLQNSLVVFHSWVPHEVRPVAVPSGRFADYRFAINCWYRRKSGA